MDVPTSADVHLYADSETIHTEHPILYADCEGMQGGEANPAAKNANTETTSISRHASNSSSSDINVFQRLMHASKRKLEWAKKDSEDYEQTSKRSFAVEQMYPKIFYAFSDVVVYVSDVGK